MPLIEIMSLPDFRFSWNANDLVLFTLNDRLRIDLKKLSGTFWNSTFFFSDIDSQFFTAVIVKPRDFFGAGVLVGSFFKSTILAPFWNRTPLIIVSIHPNKRQMIKP